MTVPRALLLALLAAAIVAALAGLPLTRWLVDGAAWAEHRPYAAAALFVLAYALASVLAFPGTILTLAAGSVFGVPFGVALVSAGSVLGATAAFLLGRFVMRAWIAKRIERSARLSALDAATRRDGLTIVLLARLSPLFPYNLLNYAFGLTAVRLRDYVVASWAGMLPATVLYVYLGSLAKSVAALANGYAVGDRPRLVLLVVGLLATVAVTVLIARRATRELRSRLAAEDRAAAEHVAE